MQIVMTVFGGGGRLRFCLLIHYAAQRTHIGEVIIFRAYIYEILFLEAGHYGRIVVVPSARPAYVAAPLLKVTQFAVFFASSGRKEYRRYIFGIWL